MATHQTTSPSSTASNRGHEMTTIHSSTVSTGPQVSTRRIGYVAAIVVNIVLLYIANNLLGWGWPPFLTAEFARVLWLVDLSLGATILANIVWVGYDSSWFRSIGQIGLNVIAAAVSIRMYQVFPFDFSRYEFDWAPIARLAIVLSIVGIALGTVTELVKLVRTGFKALA